LRGLNSHRLHFGLNSAAREIGAALGVAVVGTVLTSHFASALPSALQEHVDFTSRTLRTAEQLGGNVHTEAVNAFTGATGTGYRVVSVIVLIAAIAIAIARGLRERRPEVPEVQAAGGVG
jgi:sugar phosphate isomerase/epimerase